MDASERVALIIIFLLSIVVGMFFGLITRPRNKFHGPNAKKETKKIYYNKKMGKCLKFNILPLDCPKPKTKLRKILDYTKKINLNIKSFKK